MSRQHYKGRKRPRAWHRGRNVGRAYVRAVKALEAEERRLRREHGFEVAS